MNTSNNKSSIESKENDSVNINNKKDENNYRIKTLINKNRLHSDFGHNLTYNKKLENELDTLPNETSRFFRKSLNKYKFQLEVYVPNSMVISKKEYINKNYMLNHLVRIEDIIKDKKKQIAHISKETSKFSRQYELVKNENKNHQIDYLSKIEKVYKNKGYNMTGINYKKEDNIFNPSFLLDTRYGINKQTDTVKYGQNNYKKEYKIDKWLLNTFDEYIHNRNKGNKGRKISENDRNAKQHDLNEENYEKNQEYEQVKKEINEQIKIQNMNKDEYLSHAKNLKKEIETIKNTINNFNDLNENLNIKKSNNKNINNSKSIEKDSSINEKESIIINDNKSNNSKKNKKIIDFNSNIFLSSKGTKYNSKEKSHLLPKIKKPNKNLSVSKQINNYESISKKKKLVKSYIKLKNNKIPKLLINEIINKKPKEESIYLSERQKEEIQKESNLNELYEQLSNRTNNINYPYKQVNQYFNRYSPKKLPTVNTDRGSNIHGLVEETQKIINENNIAGFVRQNNNAKRDINNRVKIDDDYIIDLDNKILGIHYDLTDKILSNKNKQIIAE